MSKKKDQFPTPFHEQPISGFLKSIDSFFNEAFKNFQFFGGFPVHEYETKSHYIVEAQLPGIKKEQISLDFYQNHIRISVENSQFTEEKNDIQHSYHSTSSFQRAERIVMLPFNISVKDTKASFRDGLLKIMIPNKKRTIEIE